MCSLALDNIFVVGELLLECTSLNYLKDLFVSYPCKMHISYSQYQPFIGQMIIELVIVINV